MNGKKIIQTITLVLLIVSIIEILKYTIPYFIPFENLNNENRISILLLLTTIIGGVWALRLYYLANLKDKGNYLKTYVTTIVEENFICIKTEVKNETDIDREIFASFLIITRQGSKIVDEVNNNLNQKFRYTNDFSNLKFTENTINDDFAFIQLPYYYCENVKVGNEDLSYSIGFNTKTNTSDNLQMYEVRFFVFRNLNDSNPYHRSVQSVFISDVPLNILFKDFQHNNYSKNKKSKQNFNIKTQ